MVQQSVLIVLLIALGLIVLVQFYNKMRAETRFTDVKIGNATVNAELADTHDRQMLGLMFRKSLPQNSGMLFIFDKPDYYSFWMMNTSIPLDIIWIDKNNTIVDIAQNTEPCFVLCKSYTPAKKAMYVLETNANFTKKHGVEVGDKIKIAPF